MCVQTGHSPSFWAPAAPSSSTAHVTCEHPQLRERHAPSSSPAAETTPSAHHHLHHGQVIPEEVPQPAGLLHVGTGLPQQLPQPCPRPQRVLHLPADGAQASRAELLQAGSCPLQLLQLPLQGLRYRTLKTRRVKKKKGSGC